MSVELTVARRDRVLDAMDAAGLDALVLGRQDNAGYASGMSRLWTAGTRPFGAGCVLIGSTRAVHVLSSWDAGIPETIPFENLYPITWNPARMTESMLAIAGLAGAARIGVDALSPGFVRAAGRFAPDARVVAADEVMAAVRRHKLPEEIELIRAACAVSWVGADAGLAAVGADAADPAARAVEAMAAVGATIPTSGVRFEQSDGGVVLDIGELVDLYEGGLGGRFIDGDRGDPPPIVDACRDGARWGDLDAAATGEWQVRGLGMGFEHPVIAPSLGRAQMLDAAMVVSVRDGSYRDVVAVTAGAPDVLSRPA